MQALYGLHPSSVSCEVAAHVRRVGGPIGRVGRIVACRLVWAVRRSFRLLAAKCWQLKACIPRQVRLHCNAGLHMRVLRKRASAIALPRAKHVGSIRTQLRRSRRRLGGIFVACKCWCWCLLCCCIIAWLLALDAVTLSLRRRLGRCEALRRSHLDLIRCIWQHRAVLGLLRNVGQQLHRLLQNCWLWHCLQSCHRHALRSCCGCGVRVLRRLERSARRIGSIGCHL